MWNAGVPTEPDVRRLDEAFPALEIGDVIQHEAIEAVLGIGRKTFRYKTVVNAWRRRMEAERNIVLGAVIGEGYRVLTDAERVECGGGKLRSAGRATTRAATLVTGADRAKLPPELQAKADHVSAAAASILGALRLQAKALNTQLREVQRLTK
jgi:hypothetical protein